MQNRVENMGDSLEQAHKLEKTGIPRDQAEALVKVMGQQIHAAVSSAASNTATKDDIAKIHATLAGLQTAMRYQLAMMTVLTSAVIALFVKML